MVIDEWIFSEATRAADTHPWAIHLFILNTLFPNQALVPFGSSVLDGPTKGAAQQP